jgi:dolichol-phosphate mannosyltransferase
VIAETIKRLEQVCSGLQGIRSELVFIDDGSKDATLSILKEWQGRDPRIHVISFSRNFGHQIAITAGMEHTKGDAVLVIDADLQDPPELVVQMLQKWQEGYDVIYGLRAERLGESFFKRASAHAFYRLLNYLSDIPIPLDTGDFRLMSRRVVDTLCRMPEHNRFVRGMVSWVGFRQIAIPYTREKRFAGVSKYPLRKMLQFAVDGILSFSTKPLRISAILGFFCAMLAAMGIVWVLCERLFSGDWVPGWATLMLAILFIGGIQLISIGVLGEYIGRIYGEVKKRPLYIAGEVLGESHETIAPSLPSLGKANNAEGDGN